MAVKASREFVIDAPLDVVMGALEDVGVLESWSPLHKRIEVIDRYPDGRAHHVKTTIRILGLVDKEVLEYHWGPDWVVYDAKGTSQQHGQHVEYNLKPEGVDKTRVRFDITVEPAGPIPGFRRQAGNAKCPRRLGAGTCATWSWAARNSDKAT